MIQNFRMIDVGDKGITRRRAVATGKIRLAAKTIEMLKSGDSPKGNILAMAEVAGIMAAKNTPNLLPLCHHLPIDSVKISYDIRGDQVQAFCEVICHGKTGVEMEALTGVTVTLLTIYDLAKAVDPVIEISDVYLQGKEGGKSGIWEHPEHLTTPTTTPAQASLKRGSLAETRFAVFTLSDRASKGTYADEAGPILIEFARSHGAIEQEYQVIPDEKTELITKVTQAIERGAELILLTGGTGIGPRDITVESIREIADKELTGLGEAQRHLGSRYTPAAWLSRSSAFVVGRSLVVLFPGSPKAVSQGLEAIGGLIGHALRMIRGGSHD